MLHNDEYILELIHILETDARSDTGVKWIRELQVSNHIQTFPCEEITTRICRR
jgi:hypothetical protein